MINYLINNKEEYQKGKNFRIYASSKFHRLQNDTKQN